MLLLLIGIWNLVVWPPFLRRILRDPRSRDASGRATRFLTVHVVLIGVSLLLAAAAIVFGVVGLLA